MDAEQRTIYLNKGIAPVVNHPRHGGRCSFSADAGEER